MTEQTKKRGPRLKPEKLDLTDEQVREALANHFAHGTTGKSLGTLCGLPHRIVSARARAKT
jgi:hypothetical protein